MCFHCQQGPCYLWVEIKANDLRTAVRFRTSLETGVDDPGVDDTGVDNTGVDDTGVDDTGVDGTGVDDPGVDDPGVDDPGVDDTGMLVTSIYKPTNATNRTQIVEHNSLQMSPLQFLFCILYNDQQKHNYFTNYHTPTCFDTIVSSSGSL
jgi:hypothetical protein